MQLLWKKNWLVKYISKKKKQKTQKCKVNNRGIAPEKKWPFPQEWNSRLSVIHYVNQMAQINQYV